MQRRQGLRLLTSIISTWGPQFEAFLFNQAACGSLGCDFDVICVQEHCLEEQLRVAAKVARRAGYRLIGSPVVVKNAGTSGGVLLLVKAFIPAWPVCVAPCICDGPTELGFGLDWCAVEIPLRKSSLLLVAVYLTNGVGMAGPNLRKWQHITSFLNGRLGDMNMPPEELDDSGVLASTLPSRSLHLWCSEEPFTCTIGRCRHIDFGMIDCQAQAIVGPLAAYPGVP